MFHVYFFSSLLLYKHLGIARGKEGEKDRIPLSHSYSMYSAGDEHEKNTGKHLVHQLNTWKEIIDGFEIVTCSFLQPLRSYLSGYGIA